MSSFFMMSIFISILSGMWSKLFQVSKKLLLDYLGQTPENQEKILFVVFFLIIVITIFMLIILIYMILYLWRLSKLKRKLLIMELRKN